MKKATRLLLLQLFFIQISLAQNVGINNTSPLTALDVNGDIALRSADITIASTYTYALDVATVKQSSYKLKANLLLGNFILAGIAAGTDGRIITITNRTIFSMEIYHEDATALADDRIETGTGATLAVFPNGSVTLQYDVPENRWLVKSTHNNSLNYFGGGGGGGNWDLSGSHIYNANTGNVGIGTSSPVHGRLEINGRVGSTVAIFGADAFGLGISANNPEIGFNYLYNGGTKTIKSGYAGNFGMDVTTGDIYLGNFNGNQSSSDFGSIAGYQYAMLIKQNGNVGVGTTSPFYKLDVNGEQRINGSSITSPGVFGSLTSGGSLRIENTANNFFLKTDGQKIQAEKSNLQSSGTTASVLALNPHGGNVGINSTTAGSPLSFPNTLGKKISFWTAGTNNDYGIGLQAGILQFYTAGQDQFAFGWGSSGNFIQTMTYYPGSAQLGINCLPQPNYHLAVKGKIKAEEIVVELGGWADYVFEDGYQLRSLESVAQYIKEKKHLPGIPSAATIEKEGLNVGDIQKKMMEKIEELTLYMIELKKQIEKIKNKELRK